MPFQVSINDWITPTYDKERESAVQFDDGKARDGSCFLVLQTFGAVLININQANLRFFGPEDTKPRVTHLRDENRSDLVSNLVGNGDDGEGGYNCLYSTPRPVSRNRSVAYFASIQTRGEWEGELSLRLDLSNGHTPTIRIPCKVVSS